MLQILVVALLFGLAFRATFKIKDENGVFAHVIGDRMGKLWDITHQSMRENKLLRAEKALLRVRV